ncbi:MAG: hypothetical protein GY825_03925, partial [Phycisphaeraceae bacterium]|nr:hypothetical protein [Phycisphaeraceae bacterium]
MFATPRLMITIPLLLGGATMAVPPAPDAPERPVETSTHGDVRVDEYGWLREKENPEV